MIWNSSLYLKELATLLDSSDVKSQFSEQNESVKEAKHKAAVSKFRLKWFLTSPDNNPVYSEYGSQVYSEYGSQVSSGDESEIQNQVSKEKKRRIKIKHKA